MPFYYLEKNADLRVFPELPEDGFSLESYTIGDLHGNALKLIYVLVSLGIITNLDSKTYKKLYKLYTNSSLNMLDVMSNLGLLASMPSHSLLFSQCINEMQAFEAIIKGLKFRPGIELCFEGDDLNDRGLCDYYTLLIYDALRNANINYTIILSNHSVEMVYNYEQNAPYDAFRTLSHDRGKGGDFYRSARITQILIDHSMLPREEVDSLILNTYIAKLKLMAYRQENNVIGFFTHAPVDMSLIKQMLSSVSNLPLASIDQIQTAIDSVNQRIRARELTITDLWASPILQEFLWNTNELVYRNRYTNLFEGKLIFYVHGHYDFPQQHVTLDNDLGKGLRENTGKLTMLAYDKVSRALDMEDGRVECLIVSSTHQYVIPSRRYLADLTVIGEEPDDAMASLAADDDGLAWEHLTINALNELHQHSLVSDDSLSGVQGEEIFPLSKAASSSYPGFFAAESMSNPLISYLKQYLTTEEAFQQIKFITTIGEELACAETDAALVNGVLAGRLFNDSEHLRGLLVACESVLEDGSEACQRGAQQLLTHGRCLLPGFRM